MYICDLIDLIETVVMLPQLLVDKLGHGVLSLPGCPG